MTTAAGDLDRLLVMIAKIPTPWKQWPGGYPTRLDLAMIDAVMSIRFRYGREGSDGSWSGARGAVLRYQKHSEHVSHDEKMRYLAGQDPVALERVLNRQKVHAGKTKASAIVEAAQRFIDIRVTRPEDLKPDDAAHREQYTGVSGLGPITWEYLTMLLDSDGVKADTWITRFVQHALQRPVSNEEAGALVEEAAQKLEVTEKSLDHAIWSYASTGGLKGIAR